MLLNIAAPPNPKAAIVHAHFAHFLRRSRFIAAVYLPPQQIDLELFSSALRGRRQTSCIPPECRALFGLYARKALATLFRASLTALMWSSVMSWWMGRQKTRLASESATGVSWLSNSARAGWAGSGRG